jgi:hypothetical protein
MKGQCKVHPTENDRANVVMHSSVQFRLNNDATRNFQRGEGERKRREKWKQKRRRERERKGKWEGVLANDTKRAIAIY